MTKKTYAEQASARRVRLAKEKIKADKEFDARHELRIAKGNDDLKKGGVLIDKERLTTTSRRKRNGAYLSSQGKSPVTAGKKPGEKGYQPAYPSKPMGTKKKKKKPSKTYHYEYK